MAWYELEAWISNSDNEDGQLSHIVTTMKSPKPEYAGANWQIIETGYGIVYATGLVANINNPPAVVTGDWLKTTGYLPTWDHATKTFTTSFNYRGYMKLQVDVEPICWCLTYSLKDGRKMSIHGPGRHPSIINVNKEADETSYLLIEDGIVINKDKYQIIASEEE